MRGRRGNEHAGRDLDLRADLQGPAREVWLPLGANALPVREESGQAESDAVRRAKRAVQKDHRGLQRRRQRIVRTK